MSKLLLSWSRIVSNYRHSGEITQDVQHGNIRPYDEIWAAWIGPTALEGERWFGPRRVETQFPEPISSPRPVASLLPAARSTQRPPAPWLLRRPAAAIAGASARRGGLAQTCERPSRPVGTNTRRLHHSTPCCFSSVRCSERRHD